MLIENRVGSQPLDISLSSGKVIAVRKAGLTGGVVVGDYVNSQNVLDMFEIPVGVKVGNCIKGELLTWKRVDLLQFCVELEEGIYSLKDGYLRSLLLKAYTKLGREILPDSTLILNGAERAIYELKKGMRCVIR